MTTTDVYDVNHPSGGPTGRQRHDPVEGVLRGGGHARAAVATGAQCGCEHRGLCGGADGAACGHHPAVARGGGRNAGAGRRLQGEKR
eukprot:7010059-Pyramimonas_sp.AAC.1